MKYINSKQVKLLALRQSQRTARPFTRVSQSFLQSIDNAVAELVVGRVHRHPSKGKTLHAP